MKHLDELNPQQRIAAEHTNGPLMILAGAGAGKTKTITHRIAHLIHSGVAPQNILAVTFTNKAAGEMRERVLGLLGQVREANLPLSVAATQATPHVLTFHALGVRLLREFGTQLGLPRSFTIWDRADSIRAIKAILTDMGLEKQYEPRSVLSRISRAKGDGISHEAFAHAPQNPWEETVANTWQRYEQALNKEHALDFDDLLLKTHLLLSTKPEVLERCRKRFTHITIDEYQDTNQVQFEIARLLAEPHNNLCVVGDVDQCIYSWRGADTEHLLSFEETFPNTTTVLLEQNYRSTQTILAAANSVIQKNSRRHEKNLFTENNEGALIQVYGGASEVDEADYIAQKIEELKAAGTSLQEIAVLYRANFQSRVLESALMDAGIVYRVLGTKFFDRKEVKDVLSYLRASLNPESRVDIARIVGVPARGIGKKTLTNMLEGREHELAAGARAKVDQFRALLVDIQKYADTKPVSETLKYIVRASGIETMLLKGGEEGQERMENVKELVSLATKYDALEPRVAAEQLIEDAALLGEQDSLDKNIPAVSLMTVHASKGLEFDAVFVTGLEEGLFPHDRHDESADDEEERRLFYVALTRAREQVFLTYALTRMMYGTRNITSPSQFLADIDPEHLESEEADRRGHDRGVDLIEW